MIGRIIRGGLGGTVAAVLVCSLAGSAGVARAAWTQPPQPAQEEFVPIDELPPEDQLPAAPLLVAAYAFAWAAVMVYLWSIWRRLGGVERELSDVARRAADRKEGVQ